MKISIKKYFPWEAMEDAFEETQSDENSGRESNEGKDIGRFFRNT